MSPESAFIFLTIALACFIVSAVLHWPGWPMGFLAGGLAAWIVIAWYSALKAL